MSDATTIPSMPTLTRTYRHRLYPTRLQTEALEAQLTFACDLYNAEGGNEGTLKHAFEVVPAPPSSLLEKLEAELMRKAEKARDDAHGKPDPTYNRIMAYADGLADAATQLNSERSGNE